MPRPHAKHVAHQTQKLTIAHTQTTHMTPVGFEPTQLALVELESTPLRPLGQSVVTCDLIARLGPRGYNATLTPWKRRNR